MWTIRRAVGSIGKIMRLARMARRTSKIVRKGYKRRFVPRRRGRAGGAVGWLGRTNIQTPAWRKPLRNKAEVYTFDTITANLIAPYYDGTLSMGKFAPVGTNPLGQDWSLTGFGYAPTMLQPTDTVDPSASQLIRSGWKWNELGWKVRMCIEAGHSTAQPTCCRIVVIELIQQSEQTGGNRNLVNTYTWADFFEEYKVTSFYRKRSTYNAALVYTPTKYKVLMDKTFVIAPGTLISDRDLNLRIPKVAMQASHTDANRYTTTPELVTGTKRHIVFLVSDNTDTTDVEKTPRFEMSARCHWSDP